MRSGNCKALRTLAGGTLASCVAVASFTPLMCTLSYLPLKVSKSAETKAKPEAAIVERTMACEDTEVKAGAAA